MTNIIIDWDIHGSGILESQIIDIYSTNLIDIPLDEYDIADFAYYDALGNLLNENKYTGDPSKIR